MSFEDLGLKPETLKAVLELGFDKPMPIQEKVIPVMLKGSGDLIGLAQTGTGKTAAFGIPLVELADANNKETQALILCPTRELCIQITKDLESFAKYTKKLQVVSVYGGADIMQQVRAISRGAQIIVATPGRMVDLLKRKKANISKIKSIVLDEADEMLNFGFKEELDAILSQAPPERSTFLFSATLSKDVARIASAYMRDPLEIAVGKRNVGSENVSFEFYLVNAKDKYLALKRIIDINPDIYGIIFCRTRQETKDIADKLIKDSYSADALHGDLSQAQRDMVMRRFRLKNIQLLIATDVAARGLDVNDLTHVINYQLPDETEAYTHRSGRTGRAGKKGTSIALIHSRERHKLDKIERVIQKKFTQKMVPSGKEILENQLIKHITKLETVEINEEEIADYMDAAHKKLDWISKEDLIKRLVALEFNLLLGYYRNAPDLNIPDKKGKRKQDVHFTRIFMNAGSNEGITKGNIMSAINAHSKTRGIEIGEIEVLNKFTFVAIDSKFSDGVIAALSKKKFTSKPLTIEVAQPDANLGESGSSRPKHRRSKPGKPGGKQGGGKNFSKPRKPRRSNN